MAMRANASLANSIDGVAEANSVGEADGAARACRTASASADGRGAAADGASVVGGARDCTSGRCVSLPY